MSPIEHVVIAFLLVGVAIWLVYKAPFIDGDMKDVVKWVLLAAVIIWAVYYLHLLSFLPK